MFLNHDTAFAAFDTVAHANIPAPATGEYCATVSAATMLETPQGWRAADTLCLGDRVATYDGGFAQITGVRAGAVPARLWCVPAGALDTCTDLIVGEGTHLGLRRPGLMASHAAPVLLAPVEYLAGHRGVRPLMTAGTPLLAIEFDDEELIYAQTGALIHAAPEGRSSFFQTIDYGQTRALLALRQQGLVGPDRRAA